MFNSVQPHRQQPTRLLCQQDSPGQNTGVGCHFLLHGTMDWFQIGKGICQGCILSPCLFNLYAEYIMRYAWLEEAQAGITIAMRNINNLRYADDTTLMAKEEEEIKSLLMKVNKTVKKQACRGGGREVLPHFRGQGRRPKGATPLPRSGAVAERSYPTSEVRGSG